MRKKFLRISELFGLKLKSGQQEKTQNVCGVGVKKERKASESTSGMAGRLVEGTLGRRR